MLNNSVSFFSFLKLFVRGCMFNPLFFRILIESNELRYEKVICNYFLRWQLASRWIVNIGLILQDIDLLHSQEPEAFHLALNFSALLIALSGL